MYSIQFSHSVMSDSLRPHGPQHARPPCPSPTPGVYPNSWINSPTPVRWVGDAIQPSHPLSSPSPPPLNLSQHQGLLKWVSSSHQGGQSIGSSASTSVLPMNIQGWFPLGWTGWISLQSNSATPQSLLQHHSSKASIFQYSAFFMVQQSHPYMIIGKTVIFDYMDFGWQSSVSPFYAV